MQESITWTTGDLVRWQIYASQGSNELNHYILNTLGRWRQMYRSGAILSENIIVYFNIIIDLYQAVHLDITSTLVFTKAGFQMGGKLH